MARGLSDAGLQLDCQGLGTTPTTEVLKVRVDEYFISKANSKNQAGVNAELSTLRGKCIEHRSSLLYRCPTDCACVDFFFDDTNGVVVAIQSSISALLEHSKVDTIADIPALFGVEIFRYVFVTTKPDTNMSRHQIALTKLAYVRTASAEIFIGV